MERLRRQGRDWVLKFLKALDLRRSHHRLSAGVVEDFTHLARMFASCTSYMQTHRLAVAAFQLHGARHHNLCSGEQQGTLPDPGRSTGENPAIELQIELRTRTRKQSSQKERPVEDPRAIKARKVQEQRENLKTQERLRDAILTNGTVRLSTFGDLAYSQYRELVDLVCLALTSHPDPKGQRKGYSSDGRVQVTIFDDAPTTRTKLRTEIGILDTPDYSLSIMSRGTQDQQ